MLTSARPANDVNEPSTLIFSPVRGSKVAGADANVPVYWIVATGLDPMLSNVSTCESSETVIALVPASVPSETSTLILSVNEP